MEKFKCSCSIWKIKAVWARLGDSLPVVEGRAGVVMAAVLMEPLASRKMGSCADGGNSAMLRC